MERLTLLASSCGRSRSCPSPKLCPAPS